MQTIDRSIDPIAFVSLRFYRRRAVAETPMICKSNIIQYIIMSECISFALGERLKLSILICLLFSRFFAFIQFFSPDNSKKKELKTLVILGVMVYAFGMELACDSQFNN